MHGMTSEGANSTCVRMRAKRTHVQIHRYVYDKEERFGSFRVVAAVMQKRVHTGVGKGFELHLRQGRHDYRFYTDAKKDLPGTYWRKLHHS